MEKILKTLFVGSISISAFLIGEIYGIFKTNKHYQDELQPYVKDILNKEKK